MRYFAGIDMGSSAIKIVVVDEYAEVVSRHVSPTAGMFQQNTGEALRYVLAGGGILRTDLAYITCTGYGRKLFRDADESVSEITANAAGARGYETRKQTIRTIINIGGQDSKVIQLDEERRVRSFAMNDKCAAGTGRFLEMTARNLGVDITQLGECHSRGAAAPLTINSTCAVFAESEIISLLANGHAKEEIIAGVHYSIARRTVRLARRVGIEDTVFFDGGPALNTGMVSALEDELMRPVVVPDMPQFVTATGAALLARDAWIEAGERICV